MPNLRPARSERVIQQTYAFDEVPQSSRRRNEYVTTPLYDSPLLLRAQTADNAPYADPWRSRWGCIRIESLGDSLQVVDDLQSKLTSRT